MEHITTLSLEIEPRESLGVSHANICSLGPMLQSVLMECADDSYVEQLHASTLNPYSQYCCILDDGGIVWRMSALTDEAASRLLEPAGKIESFTLRNINASFSVVRKTCEMVGVDRLLDILKNCEESSFRVSFVAPASFRSKGQYVIVPDVRLMFQNLLMRYNQVYAGDSEIDAATVDYIAEHTRISSYALRSRYFSRTMDKADKIPAFVGNITLHVSGPQSLKGLVAMLLHFGEASGIGVKTSMGMGGIRLI